MKGRWRTGMQVFFSLAIATAMTLPGVAPSAANDAEPPVRVTAPECEPAPRSDCRDVDLSGRDLSGLDLTEIDISLANLEGSLLTGATLVDADAVSASFDRASLDRANLQGIDLTGSSLNSTSARSARIRDADAVGTSWIRSDVSGVDFTDSRLSQIRIIEALASSAQFTGADLTKANLSRSDFTGADFSNALLRNVDLREAVVDGATLDGADLSNAFWIDGTICAEGSIGRCIPRRLPTTPSEWNLDPRFDIGVGPWALGTPDAIKAVVVQPDGKILVGGYFTHWDGVEVNGLVRLNSDGTRDESFDVRGGAPKGSISSIALQSDGKIVVGGFIPGIFGGKPARGIARVNPDGSPDTTFKQGKGFSDQLFTVAIMPDGKILAAGLFQQYDGQKALYLARLLPSGRLDTSFRSRFAVPAGVEDAVSIFTLLPLPNGSAFVGGAFSTYANQRAAGLIRITSSGALDRTFDVGAGIGSPVFFSVLDVVRQRNGRLIVGGAFKTFDGRNFQNLVGLRRDGSIDPSFGNRGVYPNGQVNDLVQQGSGRIVLLGNFSRFGKTTASGIIRLQPDGRVDSRMKPQSTFTGSVMTGWALPQGRLLVGGFIGEFNGQPTYPLVKLYIP